jgi:hypothetical protein
VPGISTDRGVHAVASALSTEIGELGVQMLLPSAYVTRPDARGTAHQPWEHGVFAVLAKGPRFFPLGLSLAQYVLDRSLPFLAQALAG